MVKVPWSSFGSGIGRKWKERITARTSHCNFDNCYILSLFWWIYFHLWFSVSVWKGSKLNSKLVDIGWLWVSQKTAIIMEREIKDRHNTLIYSKSNSCKRLFFVLVATICESVTWLAHFIPKWHQLIQPHPMNHFVQGIKCSKWLLLIKTPYKLTFSIQ